MNKYEYDYYFGTLIREVNYKPTQKISMEYLLKMIKQENLEDYCNVRFYPANISQANMIALTKNNNFFSIIKTGEKGSGFSINFSDIELALNYMLASLRLKKKEYEKNMQGRKR